MNLESGVAFSSESFGVADFTLDIAPDFVFVTGAVFFGMDAVVCIVFEVAFNAVDDAFLVFFFDLFVTKP